MLKTIALVMATKIEAQCFFSNDKLELCEKKPFKIYRCNNYILIISGIGKFNAAMAFMYLHSKYNIEKVINLGAAGSLRDDIVISDCIIAERIMDYSNGEEYFLKCNDNADEICCATVDRPVYSDSQRNEIAKRAHIIDMEASGLAFAAKKLDTELMVVKHISDAFGMHDKGEIIENIKKLSGNIYYWLQDYLACIE